MYCIITVLEDPVLENTNKGFDPTSSENGTFYTFKAHFNSKVNLNDFLNSKAKLTDVLGETTDGKPTVSVINSLINFEKIKKGVLICGQVIKNNENSFTLQKIDCIKELSMVRT